MPLKQLGIPKQTSEERPLMIGMSVMYGIVMLLIAYQLYKLPRSFRQHPIRKHRRVFYVAGVLLCFFRILWCNLHDSAITTYVARVCASPPLHSYRSPFAAFPRVNASPAPTHSSALGPPPPLPRLDSAPPIPLRSGVVLNRLSMGLYLSCFCAVLWSWVYFISIDHHIYFIRNQQLLSVVKVALVVLNISLYMGTIVSTLVLHYYKNNYGRKEIIFYACATQFVALMLLVSGLKVYCLTREARAARTGRLLAFVSLLSLLMLSRTLLLLYHEITGSYLRNSVFYSFAYFVPDILTIGVQALLYATAADSNQTSVEDEMDQDKDESTHRRRTSFSDVRGGGSVVGGGADYQPQWDVEGTDPSAGLMMGGMPGSESAMLHGAAPYDPLHDYGGVPGAGIGGGALPSQLLPGGGFDHAYVSAAYGMAQPYAMPPVDSHSDAAGLGTGMGMGMGMGMGAVPGSAYRYVPPRMTPAGGVGSSVMTGGGGGLMPPPGASIKLPAHAGHGHAGPVHSAAGGGGLGAGGAAVGSHYGGVQGVSHQSHAGPGGVMARSSSSSAAKGGPSLSSAMSAAMQVGAAHRMPHPPTHQPQQPQQPQQPKPAGAGGASGAVFIPAQGATTSPRQSITYTPNGGAIITPTDDIPDMLRPPLVPGDVDGGGAPEVGAYQPGLLEQHHGVGFGTTPEPTGARDAIMAMRPPAATWRAPGTGGPGV